MSDIFENNGFKPVDASRESGNDGGGTRFTFYDMGKKPAKKKQKEQPVEPVVLTAFSA